MANLNSTIQIQSSEYRPCIVKNKKDGKKALFHRWSEIARMRDAVMVGTVSGQIKETLAIVEYEDGTIEQCYPNEIQFCDGKFQEYCFRA